MNFLIVLLILLKHGSSEVRYLSLVLEVPGSIPARRQGKFCFVNTLSLVSFEGMTLESALSFRLGR